MKGIFQYIGYGRKGGQGGLFFAGRGAINDLKYQITSINVEITKRR